MFEALESKQLEKRVELEQEFLELKLEIRVELEPGIEVPQKLRQLETVPPLWLGSPRKSLQRRV